MQTHTRHAQKIIHIYIQNEFFIIWCYFLVLIINIRLDLIDVIDYKSRVRRTPGKRPVFLFRFL